MSENLVVWLEKVQACDNRLAQLKIDRPDISFEPGMSSCIEVRLDGYYTADVLRILADTLEPLDEDET